MLHGEKSCIMPPSAVFHYLVVLVAPFILHQCAVAEFPDEFEDRSRVLLTYDLSTDRCRDVFTDSKPETKEAANRACAQAFEALHRLGVNSCKGWRHPECRLLEGVNHPQCSCLKSSIDYFGIKSNEATGFRYCAWKLFSEGIFAGQKPALSASFHRRNKKFHDDAVEEARRKRSARYSAGEGSSQASKRRRTEANQVTSQDGPFGPYECDLCGKSFKWKYRLVAHKKTHVKDIRCTTCNAILSNAETLTRHIKLSHPDVYEAEEEAAELVRMIENPYDCETCGARFGHKDSLKKHKQVHLGKTKCDLCNKVFSRKTALNIHKKIKHS